MTRSPYIYPKYEEDIDKGIGHKRLDVSDWLVVYTNSRRPKNQEFLINGSQGNMLHVDADFIREVAYNMLAMCEDDNF